MSRTVVLAALAAFATAATAGCSAGAPAPAGQSAKSSSQSEKASGGTAAPKTASSPSAPKPSPTPDPAGRADPVAGECPPSHLLKGNSASGTRSYYEPDRPTYASITPEACFTAGGDARAAGYSEGR